MSSSTYLVPYNTFYALQSQLLDHYQIVLVCFMHEILTWEREKVCRALIYEDPNKLCSHVHFALKRVALVCLLSNWRMFFPKWREDFSEADACSDILFVYYYIYGICWVNKKAYKKGFHKSYSMLVYNKIWFQVKSCDLLLPEGQGKLSVEMHCMAYKRHWFGVPMNVCTNLNSTVELISIMHLQSLFF